ncbi:hypothetical protein [Wenxinia marina]|uniref:Hemolysin-type calcium-binding repeat (2 copies) n=1 Tax=Wenxinia marina DSM 24838 TaxID=1123501 RepID=A0A0D0PJ11_9RHOB|nr:hypothetical protein [Wenxinia marina]KIQ71396.1 hypothetical protein Wenmar_04108 [Wenxinia marina DSM 24838]GGL79192.1 hypothetical protein GCM10011392_37120 [Wenxinia marina]
MESDNPDIVADDDPTGPDSGGDGGSGAEPGGPLDLALAGDSDPDLLRGQDGNDRLEGLGGNDTLAGQGGTDTLIGGEGRDAFTFFSGPGQGVDTVMDFEADDRLALDDRFFPAFATDGIDPRAVAGLTFEDVWLF